MGFAASKAARKTLPLWAGRQAPLAWRHLAMRQPTHSCLVYPITLSSGRGGDRKSQREVGRAPLTILMAGDRKVVYGA